MSLPRRKFDTYVDLLKQAIVLVEVTCLSRRFIDPIMETSFSVFLTVCTVLKYFSGLGSTARLSLQIISLNQTHGAIMPLVALCSLYTHTKIIKFYRCIQLLQAKMKVGPV